MLPVTTRLIILGLAAGVSCAALTRDQFEKSVKTMMKCAEMYNVSDSTIINIRKSNFIPDKADENVMCFHECLLTEEGMFKDGVLQEDKVNKMMASMLAEHQELADQDILDSVKACGKKSAEGKCATTYAISKCIDDLISATFGAAN